MTKIDFITYQKFIHHTDAKELAELLKANDIEFIAEDASAPFDASFTNSELNKEYKIKLRKEDFTKADELLLRISADQLNNVDKDYYLFAFSDDELMDVITKSDEWSKYDFLLAQKILKDRGLEVNEKLLASLKRNRIEELSKPEESQGIWVLAGYVFALGGGILGLFIGWHLCYLKKTLPNGDIVHGFSEEDRKHGKIIFVLGIIFFFIWIILNALMNR
jgi:hypothetical protein